MVRNLWIKSNFLKFYQRNLQVWSYLKCKSASWSWSLDSYCSHNRQQTTDNRNPVLPICNAISSHLIYSVCAWSTFIAWRTEFVMDRFTCVHVKLNENYLSALKICKVKSIHFKIHPLFAFRDNMSLVIFSFLYSHITSKNGYSFLIVK